MCIAVDTISSLWRAERKEGFWVVLLCLLRGSGEAGRTGGQSSRCKSISEPSKSLSKRPRGDPSAVTFPQVSHNIFGTGFLVCQLFWGFFSYHRHFNILSQKWEYLWDFWHWDHSVSPRNQQALSTGPRLMTFQGKAVTPELPNSATQKSLQWAWGGYSWALFPPWHFISWVWVAPHKKKELHPSSIYHPQSPTDLARGTVIQYTEGGLKIVTLWLSCLHCVSNYWQPQGSHLGHLQTTCAVGIVCSHTKVMKVSWTWRQWGQKKDSLAQNPDCTDSCWTKPLLPTLHYSFENGWVKKARGESSTAQTQ